MPKFYIEAIETTFLAYEFEAKDEETAREMVEMGTVEDIWHECQDFVIEKVEVEDATI